MSNPNPPERPKVRDRILERLRRRRADDIEAGTPSEFTEFNDGDPIEQEEDEWDDDEWEDD